MLIACQYRIKKYPDSNPYVDSPYFDGQFLIRNRRKKIQSYYKSSRIYDLILEKANFKARVKR